MEVGQYVPVSTPKRSKLYIAVLISIIGALQLSWATEFSEGTPFLLSLGISKAMLALIWIAGPLSGTIGQPIVGIYSDNCRNPLGRRKPFIVGGCLATCFSLWFLSHTVEIAGFLFGGSNGSEGSEKRLRQAAIPFAACGVYMLDFSISVIQASSRAFIVDSVNTDQQQIANAWAARMIGLFNIFGFWLSSTDLTRYFGANSQFKTLATIAAATLFAATLASCLSVSERDPNIDVGIIAERNRRMERLSRLGLHPDSLGFFGVLRSLYLQTIQSINRLPKQVRLVCVAEFFAWIGYFPMLFYTTTYVGELFLSEKGYTSDDLAKLPINERQALLDDSVRRGSVALLAHGIITLLVDLLLPLLVDWRLKNMRKSQIHESHAPAWIKYLRVNLAHRCSIANIWIISHVVFMSCTLSTLFISTSGQAIVMFGLMGIPWGCALWVPFAMISEELGRIRDIKDFDATSDLQPMEVTELTPHRLIIKKYQAVEHEPGVILGIHNVFVAAPQVISSLGSSLVFKFFKSDSLGMVFRFGGLATLGALYYSTQIETTEKLEAQDWEEVKAEENSDLNLGPHM